MPREANTRCRATRTTRWRRRESNQTVSPAAHHILPLITLRRRPRYVAIQSSERRVTPCHQATKINQLSKKRSGQAA